MRVHRRNILSFYRPPFLDMTRKNRYPSVSGLTPRGLPMSWSFRNPWSVKCVGLAVNVSAKSGSADDDGGARLGLAVGFLS